VDSNNWSQYSTCDVCMYDFSSGVDFCGENFCGNFYSLELTFADRGKTKTTKLAKIKTRKNSPVYFIHRTLHWATNSVLFDLTFYRIWNLKKSSTLHTGARLSFWFVTESREAQSCDERLLGQKYALRRTYLFFVVMNSLALRVSWPPHI